MFVCCKAAEGLGDCVQSCLCPANRPSPLFTLWSFLMNTICLIIAFVHIFGGSSPSSGCTRPNVTTWNWGIVGICCIHMIFALYLYIRFTYKIRNGETAGKAANQLLLYDFGVYFYIWFVVFVIVWLVLAGKWTQGEQVCLDMADTSPIVACQVIYLLAGIFVIILSLATECCNQPRWTQPAGQVAYEQVATTRVVPVQQGYVAAPVVAAPAAPPTTNPAYSGGTTYSGPPPQQHNGNRSVGRQVASLFKK